MLGDLQTDLCSDLTRSLLHDFPIQSVCRSFTGIRLRIDVLSDGIYFDDVDTQRLDLLHLKGMLISSFNRR